MATAKDSIRPTDRKKDDFKIPKNPELDTAGKRNESKIQSNILYPDNLFEVRDGIPQISDGERESKILAIHQQANSFKVAQANHKLDKEIEVARGFQIETQIQTAKNLVTAEALNTEAINLEIAQAKTDIQVERLDGFGIKLQIEQARNSISSTQLEHENINLKGEQETLPYRQQLWDIKLENLALDVSTARGILENKIAQMGQRLNGGFS